MTCVPLTLKSIRARPVVVPLKRPVVSKVGLFKDWPLILIDLYTNEGVVGHSYLEPYLKQSVRYIVPALEDLAEAAKNQPLAPFDSYRRAVGSLHLVGREGISLIATSGLDMAAWDALAKAADMPLAVFLGGTVGPVPAYNSNGLWLTPLDKLSDRGRRARRGGRVHGPEAQAGTGKAGRRPGGDRRRARRGRRAIITSGMVNSSSLPDSPSRRHDRKPALRGEAPPPFSSRESDIDGCASPLISP